MGVKDLWKLLEPAGRPVNIESLDGKILAVGKTTYRTSLQVTCSTHTLIQNSLLQASTEIVIIQILLNIWFGL